MSINPVSGSGPATDPQFADEHSRPAQSRASAPAQATPARPDPGAAPKQEVRAPQNISEALEMPQDEVEVQRDTATTEIVIKYMDRSGNVILQVPSSEVLGVARAIDQDFQQEAKARASADTEAENEGGKVHGH
jgi:uncharacterized FlaG/YvyC family protein